MKNKKKRFILRNMRNVAGREGIVFYPIPAIQCVMNEYGEQYKPNWEIRIWWIWFCLSIRSKNNGKPHSK